MSYSYCLVINKNESKNVCVLVVDCSYSHYNLWVSLLKVKMLAGRLLVPVVTEPVVDYCHKVVAARLFPSPSAFSLTFLPRGCDAERISGAPRGDAQCPCELRGVISCRQEGNDEEAAGEETSRSTLLAFLHRCSQQKKNKKKRPFAADFKLFFLEVSIVCGI